MAVASNDPFSAPAAAFARPAGHVPARSEAKLATLLPPIAGTGVPLGGIGTGGITRASDGRFTRWSCKCGALKPFALPATGFCLRERRAGEAPRARALQPPPGSAELSAFRFAAETPAWHGLFPKAWHDHGRATGGAVEALCTTFSPVIRHDLAAASLPLALFRWRLTNTADASVEASLAFHFPNLNGWFGDDAETRPARAPAGTFNRPLDDDALLGVVLDRRRAGEETPPEGTGEWVIALEREPGTVAARTLCFDGTGDGAAFWEGFVASGDAPDLGPGWLTEGGFRERSPTLPSAAVSGRMQLRPREARELGFVLVWDLPVVRFGQGRRWYRAYSDDWGHGGRAGAALARHALAHADDWSRRIDADHAAARAAVGDAPHAAGSLSNEAYFLVDGLSVHTSARGSPDGRAHFGLIECHDYALYDTLDLWIYAAEGVARYFPELAARVAEDYAEQLLAEDTTPRRQAHDGTPFPLNPRGVCPHDLGGPGEDPFVVPNSYTYRDPTRWKDLNADFVLCVFREGQAMGRDWRVARFAAVRAALEHLERHDRDGDGLIENDGTPDQTFDNIPMLGPSSYCGGLRIAALAAGAALAREASERALATRWEALRARAAASFDERLFDGARYRVDTDGPLSEACFIEQLFGPFLARRLGLGDVVPPARARSALRTIHASNFLDEGGREGAVSLARVPEAARARLPHRGDTSFQTSEIQPGFNYSLAAQLECWGLDDEARALRAALHEQLHERRNLAFQTPAAFDRGTRRCRAVLNMRPLAAAWMLPFAPDHIHAVPRNGS